MSRQADDSAGTLTVHCVALRHAEREHDEKLRRKIFKLLHKAANLIFFARVINISNIDQNTDFFIALFYLGLANVQHLAPVFLGKAIPGRIMRRRVEENEK